MNLLVTGAFAWTEDELNKLKQLGHEVIFMQQEARYGKKNEIHGWQ